MSYNILTNKDDINRVFVSIKTLSNRILRIKICPSPAGRIRIVFAMSKKLAHKPMRNKQIRRMRVIAAITDEYIQRCDIAIIIRTAHASFDELQASYKTLMARMRELGLHFNV